MDEEINNRYDEYIDSLREVMRTGAGKIVLRGILCRSHIFQSSFSNDEKMRDFLEGERNVGLQLIASMIEASPSEAGEITIKSNIGDDEC
ncbi:MAG: hypothetical protein K9M56_04300 [Victivallales bacterium]|nr:hypothetical protein [Victivallales bacterium]